MGSIFELGKLIQLDAEVKRAELASRVDETEQRSGGGYRGEVHTVAKVVLYLSSRTGRLWFLFFFFFVDYQRALESNTCTACLSYPRRKSYLDPDKTEAVSCLAC